MMNKRGQVAIFVIIALVLVAAIGVYFVIRGGIGPDSIPAEFQPVYNLYSECIEEETLAALDLAGSQGGRIFVGDYIPGSDFAPFSNQLNFLGFPVPYWYYVSGNGLIKEQVPSKSEIEEEIAEFVRLRVNDCDFEKYYEEGFWIDLEEPSVDVNIFDGNVDVSVDASLSVTRETESAVKSNHEVEVVSKFGKFYGIAKNIYEKEQETVFFEEYAVDVMRLYTPVDGVERSCTGAIWKTRDVVEGLKEGLEANIGAIRTEGNYYSLSEEDDEYFIIDGVSSDEQVGFIYSKEWPSKVEIAGADDELMVANPIGSQQGLGAMGFCYAPYHFVYDISFPVMVQVYDGKEIFQFPVVVIVDKNLPREAEFSQFTEPDVPDLCEFAEYDLEVRLFDTNLNSVEGSVTYNCFNQECRVGDTDGGRVEGVVPGCVNGNVGVRAEGYAEKKQLLSSTEESSVDIILDREYEVDVVIRIDGDLLDGTAIASFVKEDGGSITSVVPEASNVKLSEGLYEIVVYVYGETGLTIPEGKKVQCVDVPKGGILGIFGGTEEECFEITLPETKLDNALVGGGKGSQYIFESDLAGGVIELDVDGLPEPKTLEDLQINLEVFESNVVNVYYG